MNDNLDKLSNPKFFHDHLDVDDIATEQLIEQLKSMLIIRMTEQYIGSMRRDGFIGGPVHLGVGQEAVAVGISQWLRKTDRVFGAHRSHSHILALGSSLHGLFAEILGKNTGHSGGMGGSMHLQDKENGFYGSVPIVAGTVSLAVGAGIAAKFQKNNDVAVAYFGDGACEEGTVHESLNLASILKSPVLFVVENNLFASHMHISQRQTQNSTARFAHANGIPAAVVDGNDVVAVQVAAKKLIEDARAGKGPGFLEAVTYRWYGHVDWRDDIDVGVERSTEDLKNWRARDPVERLKQSLVRKGCWDDTQHQECCTQIEYEIDEAWGRAMSDPYPSEAALLERVYAPPVKS